MKKFLLLAALAATTAQAQTFRLNPSAFVAQKSEGHRTALARPALTVSAKQTLSTKAVITAPVGEEMPVYASYGDFYSGYGDFMQVNMQPGKVVFGADSKVYVPVTTSDDFFNSYLEGTLSADGTTATFANNQEVLYYDIDGDGIDDPFTLSLSDPENNGEIISGATGFEMTVDRQSGVIAYNSDYDLSLYCKASSNAGQTGSYGWLTGFFYAATTHFGAEIPMTSAYMDLAAGTNGSVEASLVKTDLGLIYVKNMYPGGNTYFVGLESETGTSIEFLNGQNAKADDYQVAFFGFMDSEGYVTDAEEPLFTWDKENGEIAVADRDMGLFNFYIDYSASTSVIDEAYYYLTFSYDPTAGISTTTASEKSVSRTDCYDLLGRPTSFNAPGVKLVKTTFTDGTSTTKKVIK